MKTIPNVKVKFLDLKPELLHVHDSKVCQPGQELELPQDVADFVVKAGKAELVSATAAGKK
jgi:hypothetical protein